ncbi:MAG TPA: hypothetical protein VNA26_02315 [Chitinophagaceae bacterium]|nr:hypothetical protein [Chitinophagaceae bacterium]
MRKFSFVSLCFSALILISSCTKEKALPPTYYPPQEQPPVVHYSDWTESSILAWQDTLVSGEPYLRSVWGVPGLSQTVIDNGAVLVYARTNADANVRVFPAMIYDGNSADFEGYYHSPSVESFEMWHNKSVNGVFEAPTVSNDVSFRYVFLENAPPANARIATGSAAGFNMDDLRSMTYEEVAIILGIPN